MASNESVTGTVGLGFGVDVDMMLKFTELFLVQLMINQVNGDLLG